MFQICSVASIVSSDPFFLSLKQSKRVTSLCITDASSINASSPELAANLRQLASYVAWISPKDTIQPARDGKGEIEIDGIDLTVNGANWTFRQGFTRMWAGDGKG